MASNATAVDGGQVPAESPLIAELRAKLKKEQEWVDFYRGYYEHTLKELDTRDDELKALESKHENLTNSLTLARELFQDSQNKCSAATTALAAANKEKEELKKEVNRLKTEIENLELHNPKLAKKTEPKHDSNEDRTPEDNEPRWGRDWIFFKPSKTAELLAALKDLT